MFHIASSKGPPEIPQHLSPECKDFLYLCFNRDWKARPLASTLLRHPFLADVPVRSHSGGPSPSAALLAQVGLRGRLCRGQQAAAAAAQPACPACARRRSAALAACTLTTQPAWPCRPAGLAGASRLWCACCSGPRAERQPVRDALAPEPKAGRHAWRRCPHQRADHGGRRPRGRRSGPEPAGPARRRASPAVGLCSSARSRAATAPPASPEPRVQRPAGGQPCQEDRLVAARQRPRLQRLRLGGAVAAVGAAGAQAGPARGRRQRCAGAAASGRRRAAWQQGERRQRRRLFRCRWAVRHQQRAGAA